MARTIYRTKLVAFYLNSNNYKIDGSDKFIKTGNEILKHNSSHNKKILLNHEEMNSLLPFYKSNYIYEILILIVLVIVYFLLGPQSVWFKNIISWKLLWQTVFILVIFLFVLMFLKFTISGYKDIKEMLGFNSD